VKLTEQGVPVEELISTVKASLARAGVSSTSPSPDLSVASVELILNVVASSKGGGQLEFCVPFVGMKLSLGAHVTKEDTHTVDITLVPPALGAARPVRGGDIEEALVKAITSIRAATAKAAEGDDPWVLAESTIDISFVITRTGSLSIGAEGELSSTLANTLRLNLKPTR
jgi:hypothetical protein